MGLVTDDNIETVVASQKSFLESLQKDNDRRVTDAKKKFEEAQKAKEDAERKAAEEEAKKKADEEAKKAAEEAEKKRDPDYQSPEDIEAIDEKHRKILEMAKEFERSMAKPDHQSDAKDPSLKD